MSTMKKRISMFLLALTMMVAMALPTFAVPNDKLTPGDLQELDAPHGHYFCYKDNYYLNQWGSNPVSGTRVTTWQNTGDITQAWDVAYTNYGDWIVTTNQRRDLALNIYRSGAQQEVNIIAYIGNDYNDCALKPTKLTLSRQTGTYSNYGVTVTNQNTTPYNEYGRICRWPSNPTTWTHFDHLDQD